MQYAVEKLPLPKLISPRTHRFLDYLTAGAFVILGSVWWKSRRNASIAALANGAFILGYSSLTDYDGTGERPITFQTHGDLDRLQAGIAAASPSLFDFAHDPQSRVFQRQALNEAIVLAMTDFRPGEQKLARRRSARTSIA